jgi:hypothetical protein
MMLGYCVQNPGVPQWAMAWEGSAMNVNVFVTRVDGALQTELLVLPPSPQAAITQIY